MKTKIYYFAMAILFMMAGLTSLSQAQENNMWGNDVNVMSEAGWFYSSVKTTVAYDGTIYLGRLSAQDPNGPYTKWQALKSTDGGRTWSLFQSGTVTAPTFYSCLDIIATGETATDFRLYVARAFVRDDGITAVRAHKYKANGDETPLSFDFTSFDALDSDFGFADLSWATDSRLPNGVAAPYCISLAASIHGWSSDKIMVWTTCDPDTDFSEIELLDTFDFVGEVDAAIGTTLPVHSNFGRLAVVYQIKSDPENRDGKLFVRYLWPDTSMLPTYSGPYNVSLNEYSYSSPSIALSQVSGTGSGPGYDDIRTIIAYDYTDGGEKNSFFRYTDNAIYDDPNFPGSITIASGAGNQMNPHMVFDPVFKNFLLTYYDDSNGKLPYAIKGLASDASDPFNMLMNNYRDASSIPGVPIKPRVDMNISESKAVFAWNDDYKSMFDAEYFLEVKEVIESGLLVYPNPVADILNVKTQKEIESVQLINMLGQTVLNSAQLKDNKLDLTGLSSGTYMMQINYKDGQKERTKILKK